MHFTVFYRLAWNCKKRAWRLKFRGWNYFSSDRPSENWNGGNSVLPDRRRGARGGDHELVSTYQRINTEKSHLVLRTVYSALFMLLCIDDTVSPGVSRHVFHSHPHGGVKATARRNHFAVALSIFSAPTNPPLHPASSHIFLTVNNIFHRSLVVFVNCSSLTSVSLCAEPAAVLEWIQMLLRLTES